MKLMNKQIVGWSLYDVANSAFATVIMGGFFPVLFKEYWSNPDNFIESSYYLGLANSVASIIVAAMAPFLGAIADKTSAKKKFLIFFAYLGAIMTGCLYLITAGQWQMAVLFYIVAAIGFSGGNIFYDALLPSVAPKEKVDFVSAFGFSIGYIGGGLLLLFNVIMVKSPQSFGLANGTEAGRMALIMVGAWWALFTLPLIFFVKEERTGEKKSISQAMSLGWNQLKDTFSRIRHLKMVGMFLLAYWFYIDGVDTIIRMAVDYGVSLGFDSSSLIVALLITQFVAFPASLGFNLLAGKIGIKRALYIALGAYVLITLGGVFMQTQMHFFGLAGCIGLFQGGIQAASRSYYTRLIPKEKAGEFFGFYNMLGKFAAVVGPILMGTVIKLTGNHRLGMASILILFIMGFVFLRKVDEEKGRQLADEYLTD